MAITGERREKGFKPSGAVNKPCYDGYTEIVNLAVESIGVRLPGELIVEILCKQSVKTLVRFKAVCKRWKLLIESHVFIHKHLHRPNPQLGGYSVVGYIVGACNGIICFKYWPGKYAPMTLYNPTTREFSNVPLLRFGWGDHRGFFYLPKPQKYQIVSFLLDSSKRYVNITTLTLGKNPSLRVAKNIKMPGRIINEGKVTCGTTIYWFGMNFNDNDEIVICYDVSEGRFIKMNMPPFSFLGKGIKSLAVFKDSVVMFVSPQSNVASFDIWMLTDDMSSRKSWEIYRVVGPLPEVLGALTVCCCYWYGNGFLIEYKNNKLVYYDIETDQVVDIVKERKTRRHKPRQVTKGEFIYYVESLVSVKSLVP